MVELDCSRQNERKRMMSKRDVYGDANCLQHGCEGFASSLACWGVDPRVQRPTPSFAG